MEASSMLPALCVGNSPVTGEFPSQRASNAELMFFLFGSAYAVKQPVEWPVIGDYMTFMWCHRNGNLSIQNIRFYVDIVSSGSAYINLIDLEYHKIFTKLIKTEWRMYTSVKRITIDSSYSTSPVWRQAIIWTNATQLLIENIFHWDLNHGFDEFNCIKTLFQSVMNKIIERGATRSRRPFWNDFDSQRNELIMPGFVVNSVTDICGTVMSKFLSCHYIRRLISPASQLFAQPFIQAQIKENVKAPRHGPLYFVRGIHRSPMTGEFPSQRPSNAENVSSGWRHHGILYVRNGHLPGQRSL